MKTNIFRCGRLRILLLLCLFVSSADLGAVIRGRVVDAETGEPLDGATVEVFDERLNSGRMVIISYSLSTDSLGYFHYAPTATASITFTVKYFGYHDGRARINSISTTDTINIRDIQLKPSPLLLKGVTVKARRRSFYMRGDTVIFNPEAIALEEGARLDELLRKLPGVTMKDGVLHWNGKPVHLLMNGQEAFSAELLKQRLPAIAVENIKAYERQSELTERTGVKDGQEQQVLDVTIKPSFMDRFYGESSAAIYSSKNYAAELDAMKLSDFNPYLLFGRVANEPGGVDSRSMLGTSRTGGGRPVEQQMGSIGYKHAWKRNDKQTRNSYWEVGSSAHHRHTSDTSWHTTETFMPMQASTQSRQRSHSGSHGFNVPVEFSSYLQLTDLMRLVTNASLSFDKSRNYNSESSTTSETDSIDPDGLRRVNASNYTSHDESHSISANGDISITRYIGKGSLSTALKVTYSDSRSKGNSTGLYQYFHDGDNLSTIDRQHYDSRSYTASAAWRIGAFMPLGKKVMTNASLQSKLASTHNDDDRWRADTLDLSNSACHTLRSWDNRLAISATIDLGRLKLKPSADITHRYEHLDYQRARLDTTARRNFVNILPTMNIDYNVSNMLSMRGNIQYTTTRPALTDLMRYTDDTDPLNLRSGNPSLRPSHTLRWNLGFNLITTRANQAFGMNIGHTRNHNPITHLIHYDATTGAYHTMPQNVRGGHSWSISLDYDRSIGDYTRLRTNLTSQFTRRYGYLTTTTPIQSPGQMNKQNVVVISHTADIGYSRDALSVSLYNLFTLSHYAYTPATTATHNIVNNETLIRLNYRLGEWTIDLTPSIQIDRGYQWSELNGNQWRVNAKVSRTLFARRAELALYAKDIFNQQRITTSSMTENTRTEGGTEYLHRYISLTFTYRFEPRGK